MRPFVLAVILLSVVTLVGGIGKVENAELSSPPEVATSNWIPLGDSFGFVVVNAVKMAQPKQPVHPAVSGYFMVKRGDVWFRVIEEWSPKVVPLAQK
jgi:hypothetical protein